MRTFDLKNQSDEKNTTQLSHAECALQSATDVNINLLLTLCVQLGCSFTVCLARHLVSGWCGIVFPLPPLPLYIWVVWGCYNLARLQSCWLILFASCFLSFLCFNGFHFFYHYYYCYFYFTIVYFVLLPQNVFQCDWCSCLALS